MSPVTLVITQRETFSRTRESLASLRASLATPARIVFVDGGSPPEIRDFLAAQADAADFIHLRHERFLPPNEAKNLALPHIDTEFAAFVDNDVLFEPGWLEQLVATARETSAAAIGPLYLERVGTTEKTHMTGGIVRIQQSRGRRTLVETHESRKHAAQPAATAPFPTGHLEMHALLVRSALLRGETPLFDPAILSIPENADLCLQIAHAGGQCWIDPRARVTVILPETLDPIDKDFYTTRWSQAWQIAGLEHFRRKWQLTGHQPVFASQLNWVAAHRLVARRFPLHRLLRIPSDSILNRLLLAPLQQRLFG